MPELTTVGRWLILVGLGLAALGGLGTLVVLLWLRERTPLNLVLLYAFSTFEGMALGLVLEAFIREGLAGTVLYAAAATAAITFVGAVYGATTKRSLAGLGPTLFLGLAAVILASVIGLFVHLPLYSHVVAAISAVLFSAYIVYDVNRAAGASGASQGTVILLAVNVYLDILNLFLNLLQLLSSSDD